MHVNVVVKRVAGLTYDVAVPCESGDTPTIGALYDAMAEKLEIPKDRIRIVFKGRTLAMEDGDDVSGVREGDTVVALSTGRVPPRTGQASTSTHAADADPDADFTFRLPRDAVWAERVVGRFLKNTLRFPDLLLIWLFWPRWTGWCAMAAWLAFVPVTMRLEILPIYVMVSIVALTYYHTRPRRPGEASAYSVFNNHQNLPGQLTARDIDRALGHRPLADD